MAQTCLNLDAPMILVEINSSVLVTLPVSVTAYSTKASGGERVFFSSWFKEHSLVTGRSRQQEIEQLLRLNPHQETEG